MVSAEHNNGSAAAVGKWRHEMTRRMDRRDLSQPGVGALATSHAQHIGLVRPSSGPTARHDGCWAWTLTRPKAKLAHD